MARTGVEMSDETKDEITMAECGACRAIVPLNSENCPECSISFSGVSDESLGECGACQGLVPLESTKCSHCGTIFVADDVVEVLRKWLDETGISIPILFKKFDEDGDGQIDSSELKSGLLSLNLADLPPSQVERLIKTIDEDGDGQIDLSELHETITGEKYVKDSNPPAQDDDSEDDAKEDESDTLEVEEKSEDESEEVDVEEVDVEEEDSSDAEGDSDEDESIETTEEDDELTRFGKAIAAEGYTIREVFDRLDTNEDGKIDGPELQKGLSDILGEEFVPKDVIAILGIIDKDEDGNINSMEIIEALEELDLGIESDRVNPDAEKVAVQARLSILHLISDAMDETGDSPNKFFSALDKDGDGNVSAEEFTSAIEELIESEVTAKDIEAFLNTTDDDGDGTIDIIEFVNALESLDDADEVVDNDSRLTPKSNKPFPTNLQRKMMGKQWNDVFWPLIHMAFGLFVAVWLLNAMGGIGPLSVDGSGGNIALDTANNNGHDRWDEADIYPCDPLVQVGECKNSLTPFSGDASSMPAGFYWDGVLMMVLGTIGLISSLVMHLVVVPGWRARAKAMKEVQDDNDEARNDNSDDDEESDDADEEIDEEESDEEVTETADEEDEEDGGDEEGIDIGSHIGLSLDDEEVFGVIIEFDDGEETVTIKEDGTGDLVTGYQEDMFME